MPFSISLKTMVTNVVVTATSTAIQRRYGQPLCRNNGPCASCILHLQRFIMESRSSSLYCCYMTKIREPGASLFTGIRRLWQVLIIHVQLMGFLRQARRQRIYILLSAVQRRQIYSTPTHGQGRLFSIQTTISWVYHDARF